MTIATDFIAARARQLRVAGDSTPEPVPSPCVSVCRMVAASGLCEGCFRTLGEIAGWSRMDAAAKRAVWLQIESRLP